MPKICKITHNILYRMTHKIYRIEYRTHGKVLRRKFVTMWRWEQFHLEELVKLLAKDLRLKPDHITIQTVVRAYWYAMSE